MAVRRKPGLLARLAHAWQGLERFGAGSVVKVDITDHAFWQAGESFAESDAMRIAPFAGAVFRLTESLGQLPLKLIRRLPDGEVEPIESHPLLALIEEPDHARPALTRTVLVRALVHALAVHGNAYLWARRMPKSAAHPMALVPIAGSRVTIQLQGHRPVYQVSPDVVFGGAQSATGADRVMLLKPPEMCHFLGKYTDAEGWVGMSPLSYMRDVLRIGQEFNRRAVKMLDGGAVRGFLSPKYAMDADQMSRVAGQANDPENEGGWLMFDDDIDVHAIQDKNIDLQYVEARKALVEDFARYMGIPPHLLMEQQVTSWGTGIAEMTLGFVLYTLLPWGDAIEQTLGTGTLTDDERAAGMQWEFDFRRLLRGSPKDRREFYAAALDTGWMTVEEVRRMEGLPDLDAAALAAGMAPGVKAKAKAKKEAKANG